MKGSKQPRVWAEELAGVVDKDVRLIEEVEDDLQNAGITQALGQGQGKAIPVEVVLSGEEEPLSTQSILGPGVNEEHQVKTNYQVFVNSQRNRIYSPYNDVIGAVDGHLSVDEDLFDDLLDVQHDVLVEFDG